MAITLFRAGNTHEVKGVVCEAHNFMVNELEWCLSQGWVTSPEEIENVSEEKTDEEEGPDETPEDVRQLAKEAGIQDWEKKRIKTLKLELKYEQQT